MDTMLDLETLGTRPGSIILSIGAQAFDPIEGVIPSDRKFYGVINLASSEAHGLTCDLSTLEWWQRQSPKACQVLDEARDPARSKSLPTVLEEFSHWVRHQSAKPLVWGNGSDFNNVLLGIAYDRCGLARPWGYHGSRCYRTLKGLAPHVPMDRFGTHHNALDDARSQAIHAAVIYQALGLSKVPDNGLLYTAASVGVSPVGEDVVRG